jgi:hypothetical protein
MSESGGEIKFFENFLLWIRYMVKAGFQVRIGIADDTSIRVVGGDLA